MAGASNAQSPQPGLWYLYLRNVKGFRWNQKRVYRIYRSLDLNLRIKPKKRLIREKPEPLAVPEAVTQSWAMAFMHDHLSEGRTYQLFNVIDDHSREELTIDADFSLPAERVSSSSSAEASRRPFVATTVRNT